MQQLLVAMSTGNSAAACCAVSAQRSSCTLLPHRMILPLRVFGSPGAQWMVSGVAMGPICFRTAAIKLLRIDSSGG